ncbi:hypothetical protein TWF481_006949 [Arthrobotrys musiformis]|uniref:Uncharacterized protein n=1 Tax=Arthrobotrys musiformis TaxID=47236 RepID=A0AAV9WA32_9PEZI
MMELEEKTDWGGGRREEEKRKGMAVCPGCVSGLDLSGTYGKKRWDESITRRSNDGNNRAEIMHQQESVKKREESKLQLNSIAIGSGITQLAGTKDPGCFLDDVCAWASVLDVAMQCRQNSNREEEEEDEDKRKGRGREREEGEEEEEVSRLRSLTTTSCRSREGLLGRVVNRIKSNQSLGN